MTNALWDRVAAIAAARGGAPAVLQGATSLTFSALAAEAAALAAGIAGRIGPGDRVILAAPNDPALLVWTAAVWHRGAIPVWLHADAPDLHRAHALAVTGPALVVADSAWPGGTPVHAPGDRPAAGATRRPCPRTGAAPGSIVFTSGSTGPPKGVTQSGATLIDGARRIGVLLGYRTDDRLLCPVPFAFDYGWGQALSCLLGGMTLVMPDQPGGFGTCAALADHAPTVLAGVPALFADLTAGLAPIGATPRDSVRLITNTGSKIPAAVFAELCSLFPDAAISLNYGLTETYRSASLPVELARSHSDAVGLPVPGVDLRVLRPDGTEAAAEEEGEIVHRGAGTFLGYWGDPERTAQVRRPDPLGGDGPAVFTGDLGRIRRDGLLCIHGRRDRQMKSMGVRVSPDEIEAILMECPEVAEAAVIALPHPVLGDMITACIVPRRDPAGRAAAVPIPVHVPAPAGADIAPGLRDTGPAPQVPDRKALLQALNRHARTRMSAYMQPRRWEILDRLPRTRSAKIDYPALRQMLEPR